MKTRSPQYATNTRRLLPLLLICTLFSSPVQAEGYQASFKNTEIDEFINTVSKTLNKTIIIDPTVKGKISVRSYETLDAQQYYQFFLSVLEVYGYTAINMDNGVLKIIPSKNAKGAAVPFVTGSASAAGDEIITRVVPLQFVTAKDLAPLLRQLNDAAAGSVVHYDPSNVLLMTGRAAVISQLMAIVESIDLPEDTTVDTVKLQWASAPQVAEILNFINGDSKKTGSNKPFAKAVADTRTNAVLITGDELARQQLVDAARNLDEEKDRSSNSRVFYLKHAKAENLLEVLSGVSSTMQDKSESKTASPVAMTKDIVVKADTHTNSLIINAPPDVMGDLEEIITQLDISRAQVQVEAIIVEVQDADGLALGVQWFNKNGGGTQFPAADAPVSNLIGSTVAETLSKANGLAAGFYHGNWAGLFNALQTNSQNNILATPSIVTLDNMEAEFTVGQDVPILTGSQTTSGDGVFNSVDRKSVGIKLKVKPQINKGDSVLMEIEQEVSSVAEQSSVDPLGATFNTRLVKNTVLVESGKTVVVGGLLDTTHNKVESSVPVLGKIPLLGALFRYTTDKQSKRNLMLFIRPTIIRQQDSFDRTSDSKLEKFREKLDNDEGDKRIGKAIDENLSIKQSNQALVEIQNNIADFYRKKA
ncbi:General secretion pathway protein D [Erwinia sp. Ejp617]|uniref:type II secretion system secretin GspD n=1 Tax=Erwinia pyrifoliae TaxID=79967 RepID=UPI0001E769E8|nr:MULTISPECIES: type II secretion system secretin GspD [Erwinia]ADP10010.1 General secretion pathway protein D [Erwinia sp. Ejp617]UWS28626.1 type II secretion system secretin GspD [Erwinia pyrifoliae]